ncbi:signal peptide peptidase SppA [Candidatus Fermentibacteria bacterium]|nr:signal peptide peptidase SppA [Candidatus Fermentibacteria bacterium]
MLRQPDPRVVISSPGKRMTSKTLCGLVIALIACAAAVAEAAGVFPGYYSQYDLAFSAPGAYRFGLYGWQNPAVLGTLDEGDMLLVLSDDPEQRDRIARWGLMIAQPSMGFGVVRDDPADGRTVTDYRYSMALRNRGFALGAGYGWSSGASERVHQRVVTVGVLSRPSRFASLGLIGTYSATEKDREGVAELALRPLGDHRIAVFGDMAIREDQRLSDAPWSVGAVVEPLPGIRVSGRYFDDERVSLGVGLSFGHGGVTTQVHDDDGNQHASYGIRLGGYDRTLLRSLQKGQRYVKVNLNGAMKYQRYAFFDRSLTLRHVVETLERAAEDDAVGGVAVSICGLRASPAMRWELRRALEAVRSSGRKVVVFADNLDEWSFHLASVADHLVLDPQGILYLKGFALGRTYLQGTLDAVGIGVEEWRYFTYKSAFEAFSRDAMSDGEREQLLRMAEGFYEVVRGDVCRGRGVTPETFDRWVDEGVLLLADDALQAGMVDRLGRWDGVETIIADFERGKKHLVAPGSIIGCREEQDDRWGEPPTIAVVYALGVCAMDEGIKARSLVKDLRRVEEDPSVKALVLRVDSPGGDALASDIVAEALRRVREKKPAIVSQGQVAASGGYWLSMYGDQIYSSPLTLTGSIGVIGGWFYNKGLKEKLGMTTDLVQVGRHADVGFGVRLPLLGIGVPDRTLSDEERSKVEKLIKGSYSLFVAKVADGRGLSADSVAVLGEGRVWLGNDAQERGLVDMLGGLTDAIEAAKTAAGIKPTDPVRVRELPRMGLLDFGSLVPFLGKARAGDDTSDPAIDYLMFRLKHNGKPLPMLGFTDMDAVMGAEIYR